MSYIGKKEQKFPLSGIIIINYDILQYHVEELKRHRIDCIIADEVHICRNETIRTKAFRELSRYAGRTIGLTGTPIINNPMDIFTILNILDKRFWSRMPYQNKYCIMKDDRIIGGKNLDKLYDSICRTVMIRKRQDDVKEEMKGYDTQVVQDFIPIRLKDYKEYDRAYEDINDYLGYSKSEKVALLQRTKILKDLIFENKFEQIFDWIDNFLLSGKKITLFFQYTEHLEVFAKKYNAMIINGDVPPKKRFNIATDFNMNDCKVLCANVTACGVGLDIVGCHNCAFIDIPFNYSDISQAYGRFARYGQKSPFVNVYYLVGQGTIEEDYLLRKIDNKTDTATQIIDGTRIRRKDSLVSIKGRQDF